MATMKTKANGKRSRQMKRPITILARLHYCHIHK